MIAFSTIASPYLVLISSNAASIPLAIAELTPSAELLTMITSPGHRLMIPSHLFLSITDAYIYKYSSFLSGSKIMSFVTS